MDLSSSPLKNVIKKYYVVEKKLSADSNAIFLAYYHIWSTANYYHS